MAALLLTCMVGLDIMSMAGRRRRYLDPRNEPTPERICKKTQELVLGTEEPSSLVDELTGSQPNCYQVKLDEEDFAAAHEHVFAVVVIVTESRHNPQATLLAETPFEEAGWHLFNGKVHAATIKPEDLSRPLRIYLAPTDQDHPEVSTEVMILAYVVLAPLPSVPAPTQAAIGPAP